MELIMSLEKQAPAHNSVMLPLLGNHEALLLNGQVEEWAKTLTSHKKKHYQNTIDSFTNGGYDFHQAISKTGKYGEWIRNRPLFAVINGFMFCHAGLPNKPTTRSSLAADFQDDIERDDWKAGMFMNMEGVLWNREWWLNDDLVTKNLQVLGVHGIAFGHTIGALSAKGKIAIKDNRLISCDVGMTPAYGNSKGGGLLMNVTSTGRLVFRAVYPDKPEELLFHMRLPASAATNRAVVNH
jgi:hypothetical protein